MNKIINLTKESLTQPNKFANYDDLLPAMTEIKIDIESNKISAIYIVDGFKVHKELKNTIVECDIKDNCPCCNEREFDKKMIYCVDCDNWWHCECDRCPAESNCDLEKCKRDAD